MGMKKKEACWAEKAVWYW